MGLFKKAVKEAAKLRLALAGPSGSGKTYTALAIAAALNAGSVAVVDTESGSASKYADLFDFDVAEMTNFHPQNYIKAIGEAVAAGYGVIILDSLSHAWVGTGGLLDIVDNIAKKSQSKNSYTAWKDGTPIQNALIDAILQSPIHIIATMRSKTDYVMEADSRGKMAPRKVGMAAIQRDGMEYEFDVLMQMTLDNDAIVEKTRCPELSGKVFSKPGEDLAGILAKWLTGAEPTPKPAPAPVKPASKQAEPPLAVESLDDVEEMPLDDLVADDFDDIPSPQPGQGATEHTNGNGKAKLPANTLKRLHAVGTEAYGKGWDDKRPELVKAITKGRSESSSDLSAGEASRLIDGMEKHIAELAAESQAVPA
jgi:hypothetical protein